MRDAKEALSDDLSCLLSVPGLDEPVRITRAELNTLIEGDLRRTVALLGQSIADADLAPTDLAAVYLTGGSSRIPLVSTLVAEALGVMPTTQGDPKAVVALGAVRAVEHAAKAEAEAVVTEADGRPPTEQRESRRRRTASRRVGDDRSRSPKRAGLAHRTMLLQELGPGKSCSLKRGGAQRSAALGFPVPAPAAPALQPSCSRIEGCSTGRSPPSRRCTRLRFPCRRSAR